MNGAALTRRRFLRATGAGVTALAALPRGARGAEAQPLRARSAGAAEGGGRPNILWLVSEDNGPFLGCYGDPLARTPALDRLAAEGVRFDACFAQPVCAPSRFTLISGMYAAGHGPAHHMRAQGKIPPWLKAFPAYLRQAGYYTTNNAKTDYNAPIRIREAWDECGKDAHWRRRPQVRQPFFSVFNHEVTHESCLFPEKGQLPGLEPTDPARVRVPAYQPDTPEVRADWARYYDRLAQLDGQIAAKLRELEEAGLADSTIVFYYSDNGGVLPRSKRFLQQSGTRVPLIVRFPPRWQHLAPAAPGARVAQPVSFVDFAPTVLALAAAPIPEYMEGQSFAGPGRPGGGAVFITRDRMDARYDMMRMVSDGRFLYIRNFRPDLPYVQPVEYMFRARGYQSWARLAREGALTPATAMFWGPKPAEELYEMAADPDNVRNLAADDRHRDVRDRLRASLRERMIRIRDNGLLPEGSPLEGYEASHAAGAWPVERVLDLALRASARDPANLQGFADDLEDGCEPVRWWAAQGCTMLGIAAAPAADALRKRLNDPSGAAAVAAAEALAALGRPAEALPVLEKWLAQDENEGSALLAANVLGRLGEAARPALPAMARLLAAPDGKARRQEYRRRALEHTVAVLEGREQPLVYETAVRPGEAARKNDQAGEGG